VRPSLDTSYPTGIIPLECCRGNLLPSSLLPPYPLPRYCATLSAPACLWPSSWQTHFFLRRQLPMNPTRPPQRDLISRSMSAQIPLRRDHPLVQAADSLDWGGDPASCTRDSPCQAEKRRRTPPAFARPLGGSVVHGPAQASLSRDRGCTALLCRIKTNAEVFVQFVWAQRDEFGNFGIIFFC